MDSEEPAARQARDAALSIEAPCRSSGVGATLGAAVAQAVPTRSTRRWLGAQRSAGISAPRSCRHTADKVPGPACPASKLAKASKSSGLQTRTVARLTQSFCKSWSEGARSVAPDVRQAQARPKPPTLPAFRLQSTRVVLSTCSRHEAAACCSTASDAGSARSPSLVSSKAMQVTCAEARCFSVFDGREGELTSTQTTLASLQCCSRHVHRASAISALLANSICGFATRSCSSKERSLLLESKMQKVRPSLAAASIAASLPGSSKQMATHPDDSCFI
mmetsp:Transcript_101981/g.141755  ORF Transcript_101981/g.141755 Transcript_101981/m.141755 type:complete len:277 (+) Transcript_101981:2593-3423(+)